MKMSDKLAEYIIDGRRSPLIKTMVLISLLTIVLGFMALLMFAGFELFTFLGFEKAGAEIGASWSLLFVMLYTVIKVNSK